MTSKNRYQCRKLIWIGNLHYTSPNHQVIGINLLAGRTSGFQNAVRFTEKSVKGMLPHNTLAAPSRYEIESIRWAEHNYRCTTTRSFTLPWRKWTIKSMSRATGSTGRFAKRLLHRVRLVPEPVKSLLTKDVEEHPLRCTFVCNNQPFAKLLNCRLLHTTFSLTL